MSPITGAFNDAFIAETYERFRRNPESVDESWRQFFRFAQSLAGTAPGAADESLLRAVAAAGALVEDIRHFGHLAVRLDPLGIPPAGAQELTPEFHGLTPTDLDRIPGSALGFPDATAADVVKRLRSIYASNIGFDIEHIEEEAERDWFRKVLEGGDARLTLTSEEKQTVLARLTEVDGLERFLARAYVGKKRFSIEGTDTLVPMLDAAIERAAQSGARHAVIGMAHRGRLNVLAHILDKPYARIFAEFEEKVAKSDAVDTGDVKYHLGASTTRTLPDGKKVELELVPNPSHLEFVNPVLEGVARALQRTNGTRDESSVLPIVVHGDAAFPGEGVVAETLNLSRLRGYRVGGTLHIIVNNQVGFTTDPQDARSTYYSSDLAKGFEIPIFHVNADDAEACIAAVWLAISYRTRFAKDVLIDLVGYRRHGHNEGDEPAYTQPKLYDRIKAHPTPRDVWAKRLIAEGVVSEEESKRLADEMMRALDSIHTGLKGGAAQPAKQDAGEPGRTKPQQITTAVKPETLILVNERLLAWPSDFAPNPKLIKPLERRRAAIGDAGGIDWGHAEALAFGSLLLEGTSVRLTGQDTARGTFSHRHAVLHDFKTGAEFIPLQHLPSAKGAFEIYNSPLSETAVLAFEYGYSTASPDSLVLWEAQFGDFANVAQPIIDQFMAADRAKWGQDSSVVMLLPHGYEGQGPEHSSARLERFLQLAAEGNLRVAYPTTPGQYFHILRRQAQLDPRRPLILMQPKSLLRLPEAASRLPELATGSFQQVIDDPARSPVPREVKRLVLCSGKLYYDLDAARANGTEAKHAAIVRVEELYPWPHEEIARIIDRYGGIEEVVWAQEEPRNMGAWSFVWPRLRASTGNAIPIRYIGRPERASPAEGYHTAHAEQQARIVTEVLAPASGGRETGAGSARS
ncbi:MAG TPA: 2-oxoglutarate dehydrogenase E1 component, partial [Gemmatimonadaceae bacterium]|nr:2-oxoglutarate dehydrogenase E1 component [Gemmatimonadaceae bacterium]